MSTFMYGRRAHFPKCDVCCRNDCFDRTDEIIYSYFKHRLGWTVSDNEIADICIGSRCEECEKEVFEKVEMNG